MIISWRHAALTVILGTLAAGCGGAGGHPKNLLLVTLDTLRADHLGSYGGAVATPTLDALAREGALFERTFAPTPLTLPSHSSILTGRYPTSHGVRDNGRGPLPAEMTTLAEMLKDVGFETGAFVGAFPLDARFGLDQGFDRYDDRFGESSSRVGFVERRASDVIAPARAWIGARAGAPYFAWVHLFDPHEPYDPPEPYHDSYEGEIAYLDHALGELFAAVGDDTLVVVTADHGEGLGQHGESTHSLFVYDSTLEVPLILRGPGVPAGARVASPVSSVDIVPTILALLGRPDTCARCEGRSLLPALEGKALDDAAIYAESYFARLNLGWSELLSLRRGGWKYIQAPEPELYHVREDPGEKVNLAASRADKAAELASELESFVDKGSAPSPSGSQGLDAETAAMLRSLGYLTTAASARTDVSGPLSDPKARLAVWEQVRRGIELLAAARTDRTDEAIETLRRALESDPNLLLARTLLASAWLERGRYREAAEESGFVLARDPRSFDAALVLGKSLLRLGRASEAEEALARASSLDPSSPDPWVELAQSELAQKSVEGARRALGEAKRRDENEGSLGVLLVEGKLAALGGDPAGAERAFRQALERAPRDVEARAQLGNLLLGARRLSEAEALFHEGLALRPDASELLLGLGHAFALAGRLDEAVSTFERALQSAPDAPILLNSLAVAYLQLGRNEKALPLLLRSLEIQPDQPEIREIVSGLP